MAEISEEKFRLIFENSSDGIIFFDLKQNVLEINPRALELSGAKREEIVGKNLAQILPMVKVDVKEALLQLKDLILGKLFGAQEWTITNKKGEQVVVKAKPSLVRKEGKLVGTSVLLEDVTGRKQMRDEQALLLGTAMGFVEFTSGNDIYTHITEQLKTLVGNCLVGFSSYDPAAGTLCTRAVAGLAEFSEKVLNIIGKGLVGMVFQLNADARKHLPTGELRRMPGKLYELTFGQVPKAACRMVEELYGVTDAYVIGCVWRGKLYGSIAILLRGNARIENEAMIKIFVQQASMALQRLMVEEEKEKLTKFMTGREGRVIELKDEVNQLLKELGRPAKYKA
jgi:PAS domain S-box-containing protein